MRTNSNRAGGYFLYAGKIHNLRILKVFRRGLDIFDPKLPSYTSVLLIRQIIYKKLLRLRRIEKNLKGKRVCPSPHRKRQSEG